jgi:molybdenum cofactor cytidylyltransferase
LTFPLAKIRGILLAAGSSSRFGANKLMHPLPSGPHAGLPIAVASARNLAAALPHPIVVVRPGVPELEAALRDAGCEVVICPDAEEGMGASLAFAIAAARDAYGWVVALADMPYVQPDTIATVAKWVGDGAVIAAPVYAGQRGHPVGLTEWVREELLALRGDEGARRILQRHAGSIQKIPVDDPGVLQDIDTPQDLGGR